MTVGAAREDATDLEGAHALDLALAVGCEYTNQTADQRRAHYAHLTGNGIGQLDRRRIAGEVGLPGRLDETVGDDFEIAAFSEQAPHLHRPTAILR